MWCAVGTRIRSVALPCVRVSAVANWLLYAYGAAHATAPHANRHPIRLTTQAIHSVQRAVRPCNRKCVCASRVFLMGVLVYRRLSSGSYFLIISAGASPAVRRASRPPRRAVRWLSWSCAAGRLQ